MYLLKLGYFFIHSLVQLCVRYSLLQILSVEFLGTFILCFFISLTSIHHAYIYLNPFIISIILMLIIYLGSSISGAHYNPAVTLSIYFRKSIDRKLMVSYILIQMSAAVTSSMVSYYIFLSKYNPNLVYMGLYEFALEFFFTFLLALTILIVGTSEYTKNNNYYGAAIALVVLIGTLIVGDVYPSSFNPAVSISFVILGKISIYHSLIHIISQFSGAILASFIFIKKIKI